jgi:hypothetical protein
VEKILSHCSRREGRERRTESEYLPTFQKRRKERGKGEEKREQREYHSTTVTEEGKE